MVCKTKRKIWRVPGVVKLQIVAGETKPRTIIAGHQLSLERGGVAMATQAAHTTVFELDCGA